MGISIFGGSSCKCAAAVPAAVVAPAPLEPKAAVSGNPDPEDFEVLDAWETLLGQCCVLRVRYAGATNYEGVKILVYARGLVEVTGERRLDPHFCDGPGCLSPVARLEPTERGWRLAQRLARELEVDLIAARRG